jgi:hypothetical protein
MRSWRGWRAVSWCVCDFITTTAAEGARTTRGGERRRCIDRTTQREKRDVAQQQLVRLVGGRPAGSNKIDEVLQRRLAHAAALETLASDGGLSDHVGARAKSSSSPRWYYRRDLKGQEVVGLDVLADLIQRQRARQRTPPQSPKREAELLEDDDATSRGPARARYAALLEAREEGSTAR